MYIVYNYTYDFNVFNVDIIDNINIQKHKYRVY